jgi:hypothetical protein
MPKEPTPKKELPVKFLANPNKGFEIWFCEKISKSTVGTGI